jgi:hypothetical protein
MDRPAPRIAVDEERLKSLERRRLKNFTTGSSRRTAIFSFQDPLKPDPETDLLSQIRTVEAWIATNWQ